MESPSPPFKGFAGKQTEPGRLRSAALAAGRRLGCERSRRGSRPDVWWGCRGGTWALASGLPQSASPAPRCPPAKRVLSEALTQLRQPWGGQGRWALPRVAIASPSVGSKVVLRAHCLCSFNRETHSTVRFLEIKRTAGPSQFHSSPL